MNLTSRFIGNTGVVSNSVSHASVCVLISHLSYHRCQMKGTEVGVEQACPKSGPGAKSGPRSNVIRPAA